MRESFYRARMEVDGLFVVPAFAVDERGHLSRRNVFHVKPDDFDLPESLKDQQGNGSLQTDVGEIFRQTVQFRQQQIYLLLIQSEFLMFLGLLKVLDVLVMSAGITPCRFSSFRKTRATVKYFDLVAMAMPFLAAKYRLNSRNEF